MPDTCLHSQQRIPMLHTNKAPGGGWSTWSLTLTPVPLRVIIIDAGVEDIAEVCFALKAADLTALRASSLVRPWHMVNTC